MKRLVLCVDGSRYAISCCQHAAWLAGFVGAEIEVVYVTDLRQFEVPFVADIGGSLGMQPYQAVIGQLRELEEDKASWIFELAEKSLREAGHEKPITTTHSTGFLVDSLCELEERADFLVLGKRGENANFATEHLGSTMERVVRSATKPCMVASRTFRVVKKVLLAFQSMDTCERALNIISGQSGFAECEIHVVLVANDSEESSALQALRGAERALQKAGLSSVCQMLHGLPSQEISSYAERNGIDLIVMGAYAHSRIRHLILGSTTTEILKDCRFASLLVR